MSFEYIKCRSVVFLMSVAMMTILTSCWKFSLGGGGGSGNSGGSANGGGSADGGSGNGGSSNGGSSNGGTTPNPPPNFTPTTRFGVFNNCTETAWVQKKFDPAKQQTPDDWVIKIQPGQFYNYNIPQAGLGSFNMWAKFGCDSSGQHCKKGQVVDPMNQGLCDPVYGCQPDIETKFEATFGCALSDKSQCAKDGKGYPLTDSTFFDGSLVDGFTYKMAIKVFKDSSESNPECVDVATPSYSFDNCPKNVDLTTKPEKWSLKTDPQRWEFPKQGSTYWNKDMLRSIGNIGQENWNLGISNLYQTVKDYNNNLPTIYTCNDQIKPDKSSTVVDLTNQDLLIKNPNDGSAVGCASPTMKLIGNRRWGALGLVGQCTNDKSNISEPTYDDIHLMFSNPYGDTVLISQNGLNHKTDRTGLFNQILNFCAKNQAFCFDQTAPNTPRQGLSNIIGHAGPVSTSPYVSYIRKSASQFYAWQYDDYNGTRVCSSPATKIAVYLCGY